MCAGASFWTRIGRIVYGASDQRRGFKSFGKNVLHPSTVINGGVLEAECSSLLTSFFSAKRK
jgi:tRNA(adenine34) deaminase